MALNKVKSSPAFNKIRKDVLDDITGTAKLPIDQVREIKSELMQLTSV